MKYEIVKHTSGWYYAIGEDIITDLCFTEREAELEFIRKYHTEAKNVRQE